MTLVKVGLKLNMDKTRVLNASDEHFDFLGYTFGPVYYVPTGVRYLGATPSKKTVKRLKTNIRGYGGFSFSPST